MASDDEDEQLARFLEAEVLAEDYNQIPENDLFQDVEETSEEVRSEEAGEANGKRSRVDDSELSELIGKEQQESKKIRIDEDQSMAIKSSSSSFSALEAEAKVDKSELVACNNKNKGKLIVGSRPMPRRVETGAFSQIPPELLFHILKFLSSEDLASCSVVCRFLSFAASDESLWRRLYCMRWGLLPPKKPRECAWKKLYIQRDEEDMAEFVRSCPQEFKEYYIQMQVAKRSQAPNPSQVNDDSIILDKTLADQVSMWKSSRGLSDAMVINHACSGESCSYYQIGDVFVCENTGNVHVCDDTCKEVIMDPANELFVCTVSGRCFDRLLSPSEEDDYIQEQQGGATDEPEPFMGSGRFARAYQLGYDCDDEKELEAALRFC